MLKWLTLEVSKPQWMLAALVTIIIPFLATYVVTLWQEYVALQARGPRRRPPVVPYAVPGLGHAITWVWSLNSFLAKNVSRYGSSTPFGVNLAGMRWYIITGPSAIGALLKKSREITGNAATILAMEKAFGTPRHALEIYEADDSGLQSIPLPNSTARSHGRIFHIIHSIVNTYLSGSFLNSIANFYMSALTIKIATISKPEDDWIEIPDLYVFLRKQILEAEVRTLFGDHILSLNPTLNKDFWVYDRGVMKLFQCVPRWFDPKIYRARDKMLNSIKRWHEFAAEHYNCKTDDANDGPDWEPYWGSRIMRVRQQEFGKISKLDAQARAAEDLGVFWAANANAIPGACWLLLEILCDMNLKSRVVAELDHCVTLTKAGLPKVNMVALTSSPLLQSIYAETLRLRVNVMIARQPLSDDFMLQGWNFRKTEWIGFMSSVESSNADVWNDTVQREHPLDQFWADRFLIVPGDPNSGPAKKTHQKPQNTNPSIHPETPLPESRFSMEGLANTWVPYGGGPRLCPGRHFAKQQMLSTTAIWLGLYDIELLMPVGWRPSIDKSVIGFGTLPPGDKIKAKIRRKRAVA